MVRGVLNQTGLNQNRFVTAAVPVSSPSRAASSSNPGQRVLAHTEESRPASIDADLTCYTFRQCDIDDMSCVGLAELVACRLNRSTAVEKPASSLSRRNADGIKRVPVRRALGLDLGSPRRSGGRRADYDAVRADGDMKHDVAAYGAVWVGCSRSSRTISGRGAVSLCISLVFPTESNSGNTI
jgi:hypothetical protein